MRLVRKGLFRSIMQGAIGASLICALVVVPVPVIDAVMAAKTPKKPKPPKFQDDCKPLRKPFQSIKNYQTNQILKGAVTGAIAGLLIGVLEQAVKRDRVVVDQYGRQVRVKQSNNIAEYAIIGAIGGGMTGYLTSIEQNRENRAELQAALSKFDEERSQYSRLPEALANLGNCRNVQVFTVQQQFEMQIIDANEAGKRLDLIDRWVADDDELIAKASKSESESIKTYAQANAVADGVSAEQAKNDADAMVARYAGGADTWRSEVETEEDLNAAATVQTSLSPYSLVVPKPAVAAPAAPEPQPVVRSVFVSAERGANVRAEPRASSAVLGTAARGTALAMRDAAVTGWVGVVFEGKDGFISRTLVTEAPPPALAPVQRAVRKAPRPEVAPIKIRQRSTTMAANTASARVSRGIADGRSFQATDTARKQTYAFQTTTARLRVAAGRAVT